MRPSLRQLVAAYLMLLAGSLAVPADASGVDDPVGRSVPPMLPVGMQESSNLTCPSTTFCAALAFPNDGAVAVGTGDRSRWSVTVLPHPSGQVSQPFGVSCASAALCWAWGGTVNVDANTSTATIWVSTAPATGAWQRQVLGPGSVQSVVCQGPTLCVATGDAFDNGTPLGGTAWLSQDIVSGGWAATALDSVYRAGPLDCVDFMCVTTGQSNTSSVNASIWATADVRTGVWTRTEPTAPSGQSIDGLRGAQCVSTTLCVINALAVSGDGLSVFLRMGYYTSTDPASGAWEWHSVEADPYAETQPLTCIAVGECIVYDNNGVAVDSDPTDAVAPVPVGIQHQYPLNIKGVFCFDASTCAAWGSDSGQASAGPSITTKLWRGSSSGGAWSAAALPVPAGHAGEVPTATTIACAAQASCTAIGVVSSANYPFSRTVDAVVWTSGPDGTWQVVAAGINDTTGGGGGGGTGVTKVATHMPRFGVMRKPYGLRLTGKLSAQQHCARGRVVKVIGRHGRTVVRLTTDRHGRFALRMKPPLISRIGPKVWVKVPKRQRSATVTCLATRSSKLRTQY